MAIYATIHLGFIIFEVKYYCYVFFALKVSLQLSNVLLEDFNLKLKCLVSVYHDLIKVFSEILMILHFCFPFYTHYSLRDSCVYGFTMSLTKPDDLSVSEVGHFIYHPTLTLLS